MMYRRQLFFSADLRRIVPLFVLIVAFFASVHSVFANSENPATSVEACITLQGERQGTWAENIYWELRDSVGSIRRFGIESAVIQNPPSTMGCLNLTGVPGDIYDLYVKGDDTLGVLIPLPDSFPVGGDPGSSRIDLTALINLREGDADNNNRIQLSDFNRWVNHNRFPALCTGQADYDALAASADFNEDGCIRLTDFNMWLSNYQKVGDTAVLAVTSRAVAPTAAGSISIIPSTINVSAGDNFTFTVIADLGSAEAFSSLQIQFLFDPTLMRVDSIQNGTAFTFPVVEKIDNAQGSVIKAIGQFGGVNGNNIGLFTVNATALADGNALIDFADGDAINQTGTFLIDTNDNVALFPQLTGSDLTVGNGVATSTITLTKSTTNPTPREGENFAYVLQVESSAVAPSILVTDVLPTTVELVGTQTAGGVGMAFNPTTGVWTTGELASSYDATLTLTVRPKSGTAGTTIVNTATASTGQTASVNVVPTQAQSDLIVGITPPADTTPTEGSRVDMIVNLSNNGPSVATNTILDIAIPDGLTLVDFAAQPGQFSLVTNKWTVSSLGVNRSVLLTLTLQANSGSADQLQTVTASVVSSDSAEANPGNELASSSLTPTAGSADVVIDVTSSNATPTEQVAYQYVVSVVNNGPLNVTNLAVNAPIPNGLTYINYAAFGGTYTTTTGIWNIPLAPVGQTLRLTITVSADTGTANSSISMPVAIASLDQIDSNSANNQDSVSVTPKPADIDLVLNQSVNDTAPAEGATVVYTVTLTNNGDAVATNIRVRDALPATLTQIGVSYQGSYNPNTDIWTIGTLLPDATVTLILTATVNSGTAGTSITNSASLIGFDQLDSNTVNNQASTTIIPVSGSQSDIELVITQTANTTSPLEEDKIVFSIKVANVGSNTATGIRVVDILPMGTTLLNVSTQSYPYSTAEGAWLIDTLPPGTDLTMIVTASISAGYGGTPMTNTVAIAAVDQTDTTPANNIAYFPFTPLASNVDLSLTAEGDSISPLYVGTTYHYTLTVTNEGTKTATDIMVGGTFLPDGLRYDGSYVLGVFYVISDSWVIDLLPAGQSATLLVTTTVVSESVSIVDVMIESVAQNDISTANDEATLTIAPDTGSADLVLGMTVSDLTPQQGDEITYTLHLTNAGPAQSTNVIINNFLPSNLLFRAASFDSLTSYNPDLGYWQIPTILPDEVYTLTIRARILDANITISHVATVLATDSADPDENNNIATVDIVATPAPTNVILSISASDTTPKPLDNITLTISAYNSGTQNETDVTIYTVLPPELAFISAAANSAVYNKNNGRWGIFTIPAGETRVLTVVVNVVSSGVGETIPVNTVYNHPTGVISDSVSIMPSYGEFSPTLDLVVSNLNPQFSDIVNFEVSVGNTGVDTIPGAIVNIDLPDGITLLLATPTTGNYDEVTGKWKGVDIPAGVTQQLLLVGRVEASAIGRTYTISSTYEDVINQLSDTETITVAGPSQNATLELVWGATDSAPSVLETVVLTLTASNVGSDPLTMGMISVTIPSELLLVSAESSQGNYDPSTGLWGGLTIPVGEQQILTITLLAQPTAEGKTIPVIAFYDLGVVPVTDQVNLAIGTTPVIYPIVDLTLESSNATPSPSETVIFTLTASNRGTAGVNGETITLTIPSSLQIVGSSADTGTFNPITGLWEDVMLSVGLERTLVVTAQLPANNSAQMFNLTAVYANPYASDAVATTLNVVPELISSLALDVVVSDLTPSAGSTVVVTVTATNDGEVPLTNQQVEIALPGLSIVAVSDLPSFNSINGMWTLATLAVGEVRTLVITAQIPTSAEGDTLTATVTHDTSSDSVTLIVPMAPLVPLNLILETSNLTPLPMETVVFTLTAQNTTTLTATDVTVTTTISDGVVLVGSSAEQGSFNPSNGVWLAGDIAPNEAPTLILTAFIPSDLSDQQLTIESVYSDTAESIQFTVGSAPTTSLSLDVMASDETPTPLDPVILTINLINNGNAPVNGTVVTTTLPAALSIINVQSTVSTTYDVNSGLWSLPTIPVGVTQTLTITVVASQESLNQTLVVNSFFGEGAQTVIDTVAITPSAATAVGLNSAEANAYNGQLIGLAVLGGLTLTVFGALQFRRRSQE